MIVANILDKRWKKFMAACADNLSIDEQNRIQKAFEFQLNLLADRFGEDAEMAAKPSYKVAYILINEINLRSDAVICAILLNLVDLGLKDEALSSPLCTGTIPQMITDSLRVRRMQTDKVGLHAENFIKLVLTISADIRVILIELAWVLYYMRRFQKATPGQQEKILPECKLIYAPIAHRLGLYALKTELEDLWLKNCQPNTYKDIARQLDETKRDRERFIESFVEPIKVSLYRNNINCEVKGRPKSIHSIWNKMQKQAVGFEKVYDKFAIRIIIEDASIEEEKPLCWQIYSMVTENYKPFPKRMRDWISAPKSSGYESLHTTVETDSGKWVEVQIRTRRMDDIAEKGQAAHWKYKEKEGEDSLDELLVKMRESLTKREEDRDADTAAIKDALYEKEIFVFTPNGDLKRLRAKATVLDFAFSVHTKLGAHCKGANINGKYVTNKQVLQNGDTVEIVSSKSVKVSLSWLNVVASPRAKGKIKRLLKELEYSYADLGKEILQYKLKQWKIENRDEAQHKLLKLLNIPSIMELFDMIGQDKVDLLKYRPELLPRKTEVKIQNSAPTTFENSVINHTGNDPLIIENGRFSMEYSMAKCCNPIPGDDIFGFISVKQGVKVHKISCSNAKDLISRYAYRVVPTRWAELKNDFSFVTTLRIEGSASQSHVNQVTRIVLDFPDLSLKAIDASTKNNRFIAHLTLEVFNKKSLDALSRKIMSIHGIVDVFRPT